MLSLSNIINIIVNLPSASVQTQNFSLGLILSANTVITTGDRLKIYGSTDEMITGGFTSVSAEVKAAGLYFGQTPRPGYLAVGVKGAGETALEALTACRAANTQWYGCLYIGAVKADVEALAPYVESATPSCVMFYTTADADVLTATAGNVALALKTAGYNRTLGQYSTYANAVASIKGYAMGASSEAYDLDFKSEPGVTSEVLTSAQVASLKGQNINFLTTYENAYTFFGEGVMASGRHFDEVIGVDILTNDIKSAVMSVLTSQTKIAQTNAGTQTITTAITKACYAAYKRGFIAGGVWAGNNVINLKTGDTLTNGYSIQVSDISVLSSADKAARKSPPIYVCIILAGSEESFTITVNA